LYVDLPHGLAHRAAGIQDQLVSQGVEILFTHEMTPGGKQLMPGGEYMCTLRRYEAADEIGSSKDGGPTFDIIAKKVRR
jgi:hypothetical protein